MWESAVAAGAALGGTFLGYFFEARRSREQRRHERALDRDRFVRSELHTQYARMIRLSRDALGAEWRAVYAIRASGAEAGEPHPADAAGNERSRAWREARSEVELIASDAFNQGLDVVGGLLMATGLEIARMVTDGYEAEGPDSPGGPGFTPQEEEAVAALVAIARQEIRGLAPGGDQ